jgi:hypothetical protein
MQRAVLAVVLAWLASVTPAAASSLEVLGTARANNATQTLTFRISPRQSHVSELRLRSGSLDVHLLSMEVEFADGGIQRTVLDSVLLPGHQSAPVRIDGGRAVRQVFVSKRQGLRPGETVIQLLGKVEQPAKPERALPSRR